MDEPETSLFDTVGGRVFFEHLVDRFYDGVAGDAVLLALYPEAPDLTGARHRLTAFLVQYWGGPTTYSDERGHPRLRMRHLPFHIGPAERDQWLTHMSAAIVDTCAELTDPRTAVEVRDRLLAYFVATAEHMRNDTGLPISARRS